MADVPKTPDKAQEGPVESHTAALQDAANPRPPVEKVAPELNTITDEVKFRAEVGRLVEQAREGKPVTFNVDTRVAMTGADGRATNLTQADMLYSELQKAYPERSYVFAKPDLKPGDAGYTEFPAPKVTAEGGVQLSSKENRMTTAKEMVLPDGSTLPAGSKFSVGTTYDGTQLKSADPNGKVWATTPDGRTVEVAGQGKAMALAADVLSQNPSERGQVAAKDMHIIVRTDAKAVDPDGKPLLDAYPNSEKSVTENNKPGSAPDMWSPKAKANDHFLLPDNIRVEAETAYGHATASGANKDYFMKSGFADAIEATAKNYTGVTDPTSAKELLRIRAEVGLTGETQVEAGLKAAELKAAEARAATTAGAGGNEVWKPGAEFKAAQVVDPVATEMVSKMPPSVVAALNETGVRTTEQKAEIERYMKAQGLSAENIKAAEAKANEHVGRGLGPTVAVALAISAILAASTAQAKDTTTATTYKPRS